MKYRTVGLHNKVKDYFPEARKLADVYCKDCNQWWKEGGYYPSQCNKVEQLELILLTYVNWKEIR